MTSFLQKLGFGLKKSSAKLTGGISSIFTKRRVDAQTLDELEELLISSDIGVRASAKIIGSFAKRRLNKDAGDTEIKNELAADIEAILQPCEQPLAIDDTQKPFVILMVGVNGAGKTTTIGKLAAKFKAGGKQVSFIAGDTFRAAAVEQLEVWGQRCGIRVFKGPAGCDAAGLCYDGLTEAVRQKDDIVFIDTAGRLQNKTGLMDELKKIVRVIGKVLPKAPHATLLTILISFLYSGGPKPISRTPFGEISSGIAMGFAIVLITGFAWTRDLSLAFLIPSLPATLLVGSIMLTNNIRDIRNDEKHGRRTLPIVLGRDRAISLMSITYIFNFIWIGAWIYLKVLPIPALLALIAIIPAFKTINIFYTHVDEIKLDKAMGTTAGAAMLYQLLLGIGLIIGK